MSKKQELLNKNLLIGIEKQFNFQNLIGPLYEWDLDLAKETLFINSKNLKKTLELKIQILGSFSNLDKSWLWSWANSEFKNSKNLIAIANSLYELGVDEHITEFTTPILYNLEDIFPYEVGCITTVLYDVIAFFKADYKEGFVIVIIVQGVEDIKIQKASDLIKVIRKGAKYFKFDLHLGIQTYLEHHGYSIKTKDNNTFEAQKNEITITYKIKENKLIEIYTNENLEISNQKKLETKQINNI